MHLRLCGVRWCLAFALPAVSGRVPCWAPIERIWHFVRKLCVVCAQCRVLITCATWSGAGRGHRLRMALVGLWARSHARPLGSRLEGRAGTTQLCRCSADSRETHASRSSAGLCAPQVQLHEAGTGLSHAQGPPRAAVAEREHGKPRWRGTGCRCVACRDRSRGGLAARPHGLTDGQRGGERAFPAALFSSPRHGCGDSRRGGRRQPQSRCAEFAWQAAPLRAGADARAIQPSLLMSM